MKKLELEYRNEFKEITSSFQAGNIKVLITSPINKDYWVFRVKLTKDQSVIAFPKFCTMGIGFAIESDWNTNLPYDCTAKEIADHIWVNKKYKTITKSILIEAIEILIKACTYYKTREYKKEIIGTAEEAENYIQNMFKFVNSKA
jgi:hypothetical protein